MLLQDVLQMFIGEWCMIISLQYIQYSTSPKTWTLGSIELKSGDTPRPRPLSSISFSLKARFPLNNIPKSLGVKVVSSSSNL